MVAPDPAGELPDALDESYAKMRRIPTIVTIMRQLDRVTYQLSVGAEAASAVQALYVMASPYLKRVPGWSKRWDERPCASVRTAAGTVIPMPTPSDVASWFELIMDGLNEAKVVFEDVKISYVSATKPAGPEPREPAGGVGEPAVLDPHHGGGPPDVPREPAAGAPVRIGVTTPTPAEARREVIRRRLERRLGAHPRGS